MFRKKALDAVSSPERLDQVVNVCAPRDWVWIAAVGLLVAWGVGWAFLGEVPELVTGVGVLMRGERLRDIQAAVPGVVRAIYIRQGMRVHRGQVVAMIERDPADVADQIKRNEDQLAALHEVHVRQNAADRERIQLNLRLRADYATRTASVRSQLKTLYPLCQSGTLPTTRCATLETELLQLKQQIVSLDGANKGHESGIQERTLREQDLLFEIAKLRSQFERRVVPVESPETGTVVAVTRGINERIAERESLGHVEFNLGEGAPAVCGGDMHLLLYVSAGSAGRVEAAQEARVLPAGLSRQEYGYVVGNVASKANHAAAPEDMKDKLRNEKLVEEYNADGPVVEVRVCLAGDPRNTANGLSWKAGKGPNGRVESGQACAAEVVVRKRRPYTYVIPKIKKLLG